MFSLSCLRYTHWFDGMALMHRFHIKDGDVTYSSRFLRSDSYISNSEKNRIVVSEFGTVATPDPCKNIFARFFSRFQAASEFGLKSLVHKTLKPVGSASCSQSRANGLSRTPFLCFNFHAPAWVLCCVLSFSHNEGSLYVILMLPLQ